MDNSILTEIKKLLGLDESYKAFDTDIIIHINTALMILTDIGIGPEDGYYIVDGTETWKDYLGDDMSKYQSVKSYIYIKTKMLFDPPSNATTIQSLEQISKELEWRLYTKSELEG